MDIPLLCFKCLEDSSISRDNILHSYKLTESPIYTTLCPNGHEVKFIVSNPKFEILFELGILAIKAEFYREAILNFAAALERFHEFAIHCLLLIEQAPIHDTKEFYTQFEETWATMSNQSERQYGAFQVLYLKVLKKAAIAFNSAFAKKHDLNFGLSGKGNDPTTLRNLVAHKGYIASYNQAATYGEAVFQYCKNIILELDPLLGTSEDDYRSGPIMPAAIDFALQRLTGGSEPIRTASCNPYLSAHMLSTHAKLAEQGGTALSLFALLPLK